MAAKVKSNIFTGGNPSEGQPVSRLGTVTGTDGKTWLDVFVENPDNSPGRSIRIEGPIFNKRTHASWYPKTGGIIDANYRHSSDFVQKNVTSYGPSTEYLFDVYKASGYTGKLKFPGQYIDPEWKAMEDREKKAEEEQAKMDEATRGRQR